MRPEPDSTVIPASSTVVPAKAGTHATEPATNDPDTEEPTDYLAIVKRVVESLGPVEEEEEDDLGYKPDLSMWDAILNQPEPEITDEHVQIGAALFHEALERDRLWKQANAKDPMPKRKDHDNYDDG